MKSLLNNQKITCVGCAKGGLFTSFVGRVNNFKRGKIEDDNDIDGSEHVKLLEIFTARQLALIESAFEGSQYLYSYDGKSINLKEDEYDRAIQYYDNYSDENQRLIAICENIVENKGTFKP